MRHIVSLSGGKDSTAMLLMMLERGMPIDEIIFCDTGKEFPQMCEHLNRVERYVGREITRLEEKRNFDYWMFDHHISRGAGKRRGMVGKGWPAAMRRWCTTVLKQAVFNKYVKQHYCGEVAVYIGYAYDEPERVMNGYRYADKRFPLFDWQITEPQALQYCYDRGFYWGGLYEYFKRVSCWCCPLKSLDELRNLYLYFPDLWAELKRMDARANNNFRDDYTLEQLEKRFEPWRKQGELWTRKRVI